MRTPLLALVLGVACGMSNPASAAPFFQLSFTQGDNLFDNNSATNQEVVALIDSATSTVDVAIYSFSDSGSDSVSQAIIDAHNRLGPGAVRVIADSDSNGRTAVVDIQNAGVGWSLAPEPSSTV